MAVATWRPCETRITQGAGRYRSLYRADDECLDLTRDRLPTILSRATSQTTFLKARREDIRATPRFIVRSNSVSNKPFSAQWPYCLGLRRRICRSPKSLID